MEGGLVRVTMKNLRPKGLRQKNKTRNSRKADFNKATGLVKEDSSEKLFVGKISIRTGESLKNQY